MVANIRLQFALRLGAGFGSQIAMSVAAPDCRGWRAGQSTPLQQWLFSVSAAMTSRNWNSIQRTLRVQHAGAPRNTPPVRSTWQFGRGPRLPGWETQVPSTLTQADISVPLVVDTIPEVQSTAITPVEVPAPANEIPQDDQSIRACSVVSEKTGYPVEMLDLELDLEADLGMDTVKQAEFFATIREHITTSHGGKICA